MSKTTARDTPIDVFVSHSEADQAWVHDQLVPRLEEAGLTIMVGYRDFSIGTPRVVNIERAVRSSRHTLIVLTPDWIEGEWTALDSLFAGASDPAARQRTLIPLLLKPCELPPRIQMLTYADFTAPDERGLQWKRLVDALRPAGAHGDASPPELPQEQPDFVNRERELDLLDVERLAASRSPYLLLSAPIGFGKTYLLKRVLRNIQEDRVRRARWNVRYVELSGTQPRDTLSLIVQSITDQPAEGDVAALVDQVCDCIVHELAAPQEEDERRAVLLAVDGVEQLPQAAREWLYSLLYCLYRRTRVGSQEAVTVRVILAGHNVEQFWEACEQACPVLPAPQRMDLGPLDQHAIEELIWNQARSVHTVLDDLTARQIADHVWYLSGGHPKAIHGLVADLARRLFLIGPVAEYYAVHQERLVHSCLLAIATELLQDLDPRLRQAVQALSVLRRINANSVQALIRAGALPEGTNEIRLLGDLQRAHVLVGPSIAEPFYRDRFMRHIFV
ncbi:MAG: TIR domain-containing protein, partial [Anaerolineae bacterium]